VGAGLGLGPECADGIVEPELGGGDVHAEVDLADLALAVVGGEEVLRDMQFQLLFLQLRIVFCHRCGHYIQIPQRKSTVDMRCGISGARYAPAGFFLPLTRTSGRGG